MTSSGQCACLGDDCLAAREAIRKAARIAELADESHFGASISRCAGCGQHFLTMFCERIDWADGDDPQTWVAVPVSGDEAQRLQSANVAADESAILGIIAGERRFLFHDTPKGGAGTLAWMTRPLFIPAHD